MFIYDVREAFDFLPPPLPLFFSAFHTNKKLCMECPKSLNSPTTNIDADVIKKHSPCLHTRWSSLFPGEYVVKEIETLYALKKYRAMKKRYYDWLWFKLLCSNKNDCLREVELFLLQLWGFYSWYEKILHKLETIFCKVFGRRSLNWCNHDSQEFSEKIVIPKNVESF